MTVDIDNGLCNKEGGSNNHDFQKNIADWVKKHDIPKKMVDKLLKL